jgi:sialate O-acetylesterase
MPYPYSCRQILKKASRYVSFFGIFPFITFNLLLSIAFRVQAEPDRAARVGLPATFSVCKILTDNMVIQRGKPLLLSGQAPPNAPVKIKVSWKKTRMYTFADSTGNWQIMVPVGGADSRPQTVTCQVRGFGDVCIRNILIGDVWICSGQSNMVMPLDSVSPFKGVLNFRQEIAAASYPAIRVLDVQEYQKTVISDGIPPF